MPKTTAVPFDLRQEILRVHHLDPSRSARKIAKDFNLHHKTISRILRDSPVSCERPESKYEVPLTENLVETSVMDGDSWTITLPKTRICTLEQLVEHCQIDLRIWEVERWVCNKWEMGYKDKAGEAQVEPLFQVKAFLKKRKEMEAALREIEDLKREAKEHAPLPLPMFPARDSSGLMLEVNFPDAHLGKLAWGVETGHGNYDVKIAESVYWTALETILDRVRDYNFDQILYVVGNDLLNSDDIEGRTTSGTYVSSDARYHKTFASVRNLMAQSIERLRQLAPVKVMIVSGNHDQLSCWHLGDSLECFFHKYKDVEIDNLPRARKYHEFGNVGLMFTHGHKGKRTDYPAIMAAEQPQMWGRTKFRECHTGHLHMTKTDEQHGFRTRILPSLTAPDDWLSTNGFVGNLRNAEGYIWSKQEGLIGQVYYTVPE